MINNEHAGNQWLTMSRWSTVNREWSSEQTKRQWWTVSRQRWTVSRQCQCWTALNKSHCSTMYTKHSKHSNFYFKKIIYASLDCTNSLRTAFQVIGQCFSLRAMLPMRPKRVEKKKKMGVAINNSNHAPSEPSGHIRSSHRHHHYMLHYTGTRTHKQHNSQVT